MIVTIHGQSFGIDTADWSNETSAEKAAGKLEDWLLSLTEQQAADLWSQLTDGAFEAPMAQAAIDAGNRCALEVFKEEDWASIPGTGHNCDVYAA